MARSAPRSPLILGVRGPSPAWPGRERRRSLVRRLYCIFEALDAHLAQLTIAGSSVSSCVRFTRTPSARLMQGTRALKPQVPTVKLNKALSAKLRKGPQTPLGRASLVLLQAARASGTHSPKGDLPQSAVCFGLRVEVCWKTP